MKEFIGIPFRNGEPTFNGANCVTLVELVYKEELGIDIPKIRIESGNHKRAWLEFLNQISKRWIEVKEPKKYDVIAMAYDVKHPRVVQHFGVYLGDGKLLHSLENVGSHIESISNMKYYIKGFYRWH